MSMSSRNLARLGMVVVRSSPGEMANQSEETHTHFQSHLSETKINEMLRDGSYNVHFSNYLRAKQQERCNLTQLFEKKLSPSDVGGSKLSRLVIHRKDADEHFPPLDKNTSTEVVLFDQEDKAPWAFRYNFYETFTLTKGWNKFMKEKALKENDRVIFSAFENDGQRICFIGVAKKKVLLFGVNIAS